MAERLSFGDICAVSAVGAFSGAIWLGALFPLITAIWSGAIEDIVWFIVAIPFAVILSFFFAWPLGIAVGAAFIGLLGWTRLSAVVSGLATASLILLCLSGFSWPPFTLDIIVVASATLSAGIVGGLMAYRAMQASSRFGTEYR